jgi:hypothetical protein
MSDAPARFIGRCARCRTVYRAEGPILAAGRGHTCGGIEVSIWNGGWQGTVTCATCPPLPGMTALVLLRKVRGVYSPHRKCGARCRAATGPNCECQCGGTNHGAGG